MSFEEHCPFCHTGTIIQIHDSVVCNTCGASAPYAPAAVVTPVPDDPVAYWRTRALKAEADLAELKNIESWRTNPDQMGR